MWKRIVFFVAVSCVVCHNISCCRPRYFLQILRTLFVYAWSDGIESTETIVLNMLKLSYRKY